ncbi:MAG: RagB/SusD family nutrient uptake outer membrane protein [Bacteroidota bacterium]
MKKYSYIILGLISLFFIPVSCNEGDILDLTNPNELSSETFYQTGEQARAAVNVIYNSFQTRDLYRRRYFFLHDLLSSEATGLGSLGGDMVQLEQRTFDSSNPAIGQIWTGYFRGIHRSNLVISNVPQTSQAISETERQQYLGEAHFLRAWFYFELIAVFGDAPLLTQPANDEVVAGVARSSIDGIYDLILSDLDFAMQNLPAKSDYPASEAGRATSGAAQALKGKVLLFKGDYAAAETELQKVVSSGEYQLMDDFTDNFKEETENNLESIFEIQFGSNVGAEWGLDGSGNGDVTFRGQEYGFKEWRNVIPSERLKSEFEDGDPRFAFTFYGPCDLFNNGQDTIYSPNACPPPSGKNATTPDDLPSWRKYQQHYRQAGDNTRSPINFRYLRYSDVLLMLAECKAEQGDLSSAIDFCNQVRSRANVAMPDYPTAEYPFGNKEEAIEAIYHERIVELAGEQVWYKDLLRRPDFMSDWVPQAQLPKHLLLPIPQSEIDNNQNISNGNQNPGY